MPAVAGIAVGLHRINARIWAGPQARLLAVFNQNGSAVALDGGFGVGDEGRFQLARFAQGKNIFHVQRECLLIKSQGAAIGGAVGLGGISVRQVKREHRLRGGKGMRQNMGGVTPA